MAAKPDQARPRVVRGATCATWSGVSSNSDPTGDRFTPADAFLREHPHLRLDTTALSAPETAEHVLTWLDQR